MGTADKSWSGFSTRLSIACVSLNSDEDPDEPGLQNSIAIDTFTINITDECAQTKITGADRGDFNTFLYQESVLDYSPPSQDLDCPAPEVILVPLASTSPDPANCSVDQATSTILLNPAERDDQGEYTFCLKTCVTYVVDGASGTEDVVCSESQPFTVILEDPCDTTEIVSAGFDRVMGKP